MRQDLLGDCFINNGSFHCDFIYNKEKLQPDYVEWMKTTYIKLLSRIVKNPAVSLQDLENTAAANESISFK